MNEKLVEACLQAQCDIPGTKWDDGMTEGVARIHRMKMEKAIAAHSAFIREAAVAMPAYDAGLLNDFGGGNVEWWQDYIRAELGRADEYYRSAMLDQIERTPDEG